MLPLLFTDELQPLGWKHHFNKQFFALLNINEELKMFMRISQGYLRENL
jgi:hypothetical protein